MLSQAFSSNLQKPHFSTASLVSQFDLLMQDDQNQICKSSINTNSNKDVLVNGYILSCSHCSESSVPNLTFLYYLAAVSPHLKLPKSVHSSRVNHDLLTLLLVLDFSLFFSFLLFFFLLAYNISHYCPVRFNGCTNSHLQTVSARAWVRFHEKDVPSVLKRERGITKRESVT